MKKIIILFIASLVMLGACNTARSIKHALTDLSPYDRYLKNLESANLHERPMVKEWIAEGNRAMNDSVVVNLPFTETGQFLSHTPKARSYRFSARDGQVLTVNGATTATADAKLFMDLFIWKDDKWKHLATSDSSLTLSHEFTKNSNCLLRIQPELLVNAYYTMSISATPVLINPVSGASNRSIQSFYGAPRDGGKRSHEGVDIFSKKGTPVIAPTHGVVSRVGYSRLGGKVVWMSDRKRGHSYYFAHLDSQYVSAGMVLKQGDTLGTVGNTGNARYTPPHLHFGIYQAGSKDPLYYIQTLDEVVEASPLDTLFEIQPYKTIGKKQLLRAAPTEKSHVINELERDTFVKVIAQSREWYRVSLPNQVEGFILKKEITPLAKNKALTIDKPTNLLIQPDEASIVLDYLNQNIEVEVLAQFEQFQFIKTPGGLEGWIRI